MAGEPRGIVVSARNHVQALDGLRGVAIAMVFLYHLRGPLPELVGLPWLRVGLHSMSMLWAGVDLFFALSGFLITNILLNTQGSPHHLRNFYGRRTLRIFPVYYVTLAVYFGLSWIGASWTTEGTNSAWYWGYGQNWLQALGEPAEPMLEHYWSLAIEEQFYVFWPLALLLLRTPRQALILCASVVAGCLALRVILVEDGASTQFLHYSTITRIDSLAWGALAAVAGRCIDVELIREWATRALYVAAAVIVGATVVNLESPVWNNAVMQTIGYTGIAMFSTAIIIRVVLVPDGRLASLLSGRYLRFLGKYSYAIYLFHWPIIGLFAELFAHVSPSPLVGVGFVVASVAASVTAALLSWYVLEAPILRLKRYF